MYFLKILTPTNIAEEQERFFASESYHPIFQYVWEKEDLSDYISTHPSKKEITLAILSQNHNEIVSKAIKLYQTRIENPNLKRAEEVIKSIPDYRAEDINSIKDLFEEGFRKLGINYECKIVDRRGFTARPNHKLKTLLISSSAVLEHMSSEAIVKHEMVHICKEINKEFNVLKKRNDFLPTEEGLASFIGDFHTQGGSVGYFRHAAEYVASNIGLEGSLRDIYNFFKGLGFSQELAWQRGIRHKFGFKDTSKPGDILKPAMYFEFEEKIKLLNQDEILRLFMGKFALDDLADYPVYKGYFTEKQLIEYFGL